MSLVFCSSCSPVLNYVRHSAVCSPNFSLMLKMCWLTFNVIMYQFCSAFHVFKLKSAYLACSNENCRNCALSEKVHIILVTHGELKIYEK
jgi:hypothetical protein